MSYTRHAHLVFVLAVLVAAFVALHPYLDEAGLCGLGGCPEPSQSSHTAHAGYSGTCLVVALVASGVAVFAVASFLGRLRAADHRSPAETYLAPDTPPPRVLLGR